MLYAKLKSTCRAVDTCFWVKRTQRSRRCLEFVLVVQRDGGAGWWCFLVVQVLKRPR